MQFIPQGIPAGVGFMYEGNVLPAGYLWQDGGLASRTIHAALFAAIGTTHGAGDGVTTFNVPDKRDRFVRGSSNMGGTGAAGRDPNANTRTAGNAGGSTSGVGSVQGDCIQNFVGTVRGDAMSDPNYKQIIVGTGAFVNQYTSTLVVNAGGATQSGRVTQLAFDPPSAGARTSSETRPQNISVNYIIKI
jgi:microcystin-dependent protein